MSNTFLLEIAEVFEIGSEDLKDEMLFQSKAPWDSLRVLSVISLVDEFYSVALSTNDVMKCRNVDELFGVVRSKGGSI